MSVSSQVRKLSTSPFSRDVHMTNQKLKSMQQHTEHILKMNQKKNMSLATNLGSKIGVNNNTDDAASSQLYSQSQKFSCSSNTTSPKISPREQLPSSLILQANNTLNSKMSSSKIQTQTNNVAQKNTNLTSQQSIQSHNLSKQAQNSLKQLQKTLHQNSSSNTNKGKSQSQIPGKYTLQQDTQNIRISTLGNSLKPSEDTPKFKHLKNGDWQSLESIQGLNNLQSLTGIEEFVHQNNTNVLCSVFSFGHDSDDEENGNLDQEKVKRCEPAKPSQFSQVNSSSNGEKKKRVSFCDPTIHTFSADEDIKRFDHYYAEKNPTKNNQNPQLLNQIPSCLSQKNNQARHSSPISASQQPVNQPVSIIKKHDQTQIHHQKSNLTSENCQNNQFVNNQQNINQNNKADNNNIIDGVFYSMQQAISQDQLNNHAIFESFAPKQPQGSNIQHYSQQSQMQNQIQKQNQISNNLGNQRYSSQPVNQQNQPNSISVLIQNAFKNFNQNTTSQSNLQNRSQSPHRDDTSMNRNIIITDKINHMNIIKETSQITKDQSSTTTNIQQNNSNTQNSKLEEARKNLVKRDSHSISEIISVSPLKKTTSHEYLLCKDQNGNGNQNDQFSSRSELVLARLSKQDLLSEDNNKNMINQEQKLVNEFSLQDVQNIKIENYLQENTSKSNASIINQQKNNTEVTNNYINNNNYNVSNADIFLNNNFASSTLIGNSPHSSIPQSYSAPSNNNNSNQNAHNFPTTSMSQIAQQNQQGSNQKDNNNIASAASSFISSCSPPYRSYDQTTLAGSSNFANTDIKLSIIQPVNASSFAFGSQITLSPQESISSIQTSQTYNLNLNSNPNQNAQSNPYNSYYQQNVNPLSNNSLNNFNGLNSLQNNLQGNQSNNQLINQQNLNNNSNVIYLSNQKGIQIPTCLSSSSSDANANNNTTANTNNSCANLDLYKVNVPSFDPSEKSRQEKNSQNIIKINLEEIANSSLNINCQKEEQKDLSSNSNTITNNSNLTNNQAGSMTATSLNNNCTINSPFSIQSNQNFTMTSTATAFTNNRQSFETNFWRNEAELTPSEYFLSFITNNPKPCPKPSIGGGIGTPQSNPLNQKKNSISVKDSFISTQSHFIPKQNIDNNLDSSIEFYQNNFSSSCSYIKQNNQTNSKLSLSNTASYGIEQSKVKSKSPNRLNSYGTTSLKSSQCSSTTQSKKQIQTLQQQAEIKGNGKNKSYSNYTSTSQNNIHSSDTNPYQQQFYSQYYSKTSLSPSKRLNQIEQDNNNNNQVPNQSQKRPVFLEYNNVSSIKKSKNLSSSNNNTNTNNKNQEVRNKITSQLNKRKTSEQSQVKKDITSFYNIQKITQQNNMYNNSLNKRIGTSNHNNSRDQIIQNYYQFQNNFYEKATEPINNNINKNYSQERQAKNSSLI
ncbi:hypothetical protein TTHERM_00222220 (macronuclear) [Tetrahymena thermophila SB210]|uniref:Uncharacterized protein n=1 Tax=Tetrahymena thermophila (strain SB210) TaxID=312017 RepID=Q23C63_TETTS|nr:hypothetical protein TTHERM_00222220 [Tetrahymena thermophila SB210]EAR93905.1 hypothetical protein TTHERM_00222220 [Tetrahymena thermophila SB210]|eukprot:XP_001014150.1 hypothetical protein TTHERM_00222220 [Tetrahymena thermophila SB210]